MLVAIVFRSLPNSVFDHFHTHQHAGNITNDKTSVGDHKHNCHIEDWNFESFDVVHQVHLPFQHAIKQTLTGLFREPMASIVISQTGRGPPLS
jgi:hypothetical protein